MSCLGCDEERTDDKDIPHSCEDINDVFDSIACSENKIVSAGFKEGFEKGKHTGELEGYHLGYHRGAELGQELGYYKGIIIAFKSVAEESLISRHKTTVDKMIELINSFPQTNDEEVDIVSMRDTIRSLFKKLSSLLKIEVKGPEGPSITF